MMPPDICPRTILDILPRHLRDAARREPWYKAARTEEERRELEIQALGTKMRKARNPKYLVQHPEVHIINHEFLPLLALLRDGETIGTLEGRLPSADAHIITELMALRDAFHNGSHPTGPEEADEGPKALAHDHHDEGSSNINTGDSPEPRQTVEARERKSKPREGQADSEQASASSTTSRSAGESEQSTDKDRKWVKAAPLPEEYVSITRPEMEHIRQSMRKLGADQRRADRQMEALIREEQEKKDAAALKKEKAKVPSRLYSAPSLPHVASSVISPRHCGSFLRRSRDTMLRRLLNIQFSIQFGHELL